ncbi:hypothetical protein ABMA28_013903 [Loxostege sticticalis]|uniref:Retrovirus-related Pol polyprotein from transposon TNT 1-94 n=1 Tax=Loxostege sticticalis TaxID=481309 RepID=A0ABD0TK21_LOXSC
MSSNNTMALIEKLTGRENYPTWKFAVQTYLEHEELWSCVSSKVVTDSKLDTKAKSKIILLVNPINYVHIQEATTAKEVWDNLAKAFDDKGLTRRVGLLRELITTTLENCQSIEEYVNKIMTTAHKLRNIGFLVNDEWLGTLLLAGLPEMYQPMIMAIESSGVAITADSVKTKLLQDVRNSESAALYVNKGKGNQTQGAKQAFNNKTSKGPRCFVCNKYGHISKYCRNKKKEQKSKEDSGYVAVFSATTSNSNSSWFIDSGASMHLTMHREWLYDEIPPPVSTIKVANDKKLIVKSCGKVDLNVVGARYFVTFIDDFTRKVFVYLLTNKSDVFNKFKEFKAYAENQLSTTIKILRTDNGREYLSNDFQTFLKKSGIIHQTSVPYTPQQNGLAERMNRTLLERARCMIINASLQKQFWGEAVTTAAYITNRCPTRSLAYSTPEEMWTGKALNISHMRIFGSEAMVHIPKEKTKKWDSKASKMIFVGYSEESKGYRLLDPKTKKVVISRDVTFLENTIKRDFAPVPLTESSTNQNTNERDSTCSDMENSSTTLETSNLHESSEDYQTDEGSLYEPDETIIDEMQSNITTRSKYKAQNDKNNIYLCSSLSSELDIPESYSEAISSENTNSCEWKQSIEDELQSHAKNNTWSIVEKPEKERLIGCKWVFRIKEGESAPLFKSRLCAKGCGQKQGVDYTETFSPTVRYDSVRVLLSEAAQHNFEMMQFDVKTAFLYGDVQENIYMKPPEGLDVPPNMLIPIQL